MESIRTWHYVGHFLVTPDLVAVVAAAAAAAVVDVQAQGSSHKVWIHPP